MPIPAWSVEASMRAILKKNINPQAVLIQSVNYRNFSTDGDSGA